MRKYLMALAATALLASQAAAATISGPTTVEAGATYTYTYQPDTPVSLLEGYTLYTMYIEVNGNPATSFNYYGSVYPADNSFTFDWVFDTTGPAVLSISSVLVSYVNASILLGDGFFDVIKGELTRFEVFNTGRDEDGGGPPLELKVSVVPIGGTLPLLLAALAAFGWVARRRKAEAALPA